MMCSLDKTLLYSYGDGTIGPLEKIFVEEHLKYCTECNKELKLIKGMEDGLMKMEACITLPEKLSIIAELVAENCIDQIEKEAGHLEAFNYFQHAKKISRTIVNSQKYRYENPYNNYIKKSIENAAKTVVKPIKSYCKKKVSELSLFKLLKVG